MRWLPFVGLIFAAAAWAAPVATLCWTNPSTEGGTCDSSSGVPLPDPGVRRVEFSRNTDIAKGIWKLVPASAIPFVAGAKDSVRIGLQNGITKLRVSTMDEDGNRSTSCHEVWYMVIFGRIIASVRNKT